MALDGVLLRHLKNELESKILGGRVDKIYQPNKEEIVLTIRTRELTYKLLISSRANSSRIHITNHSIDNPHTPPMLCMLLRKKLCGAKLINILQPELERILFLDFDAINELGDKEKLTLVVEIMGKYSNAILLDSEYKIIDALKRVDAEMSSKRLVLPGIKYNMPPPQGKINILEYTVDDVIGEMSNFNKDISLSRWLLSKLQGFSPIVCNEIEYLIGKGKDVFINSILKEEKERLYIYLTNLKNCIDNVFGRPFIIRDSEEHPIDLSYISIKQYGSFASSMDYSTFSKLLDEFYYERDKNERIKTRSHDLIKFINNYIDRLKRKIYSQNLEISQCKSKDLMRMYGDIINANLYNIKNGCEVVSLENFYDKNCHIVKIKLNPLLTPSQNAQHYYKEYQKLKTAEKVLADQITYAEEELRYMESILDLLSRAETEDDLMAIKQELVEQKYLKKTSKNSKKISSSFKPIEFKSTGGFKILVGRNNNQNDLLTLKKSNKNDIWFHVKDIPGSHTIMQIKNKEPSKEDIIEAAIISAYHSKAKQSSQVPVDYTQVRNVKKPKNAKPGNVIYVNYNTVYVTPKLDVVDELKL